MHGDYHGNMVGTAQSVQAINHRTAIMWFSEMHVTLTTHQLLLLMVEYTLQWTHSHLVGGTYRLLCSHEQRSFELSSEVCHQLLSSSSASVVWACHLYQWAGHLHQ